jgi:putative membrane protein
MSFFRVAFREFTRLLSTKMRRIALVALITIPSLYTGLYLYSNIDPYGKMTNVPVAIVQSDVPVALENTMPSTGEGDSGDSNGVTTKDGKITLDLGKEVFNNIMKMHPFDLQETTFDDAVKGINSGKYTFGIHIKSDFSKNLSTIYSAILGSKPVDSTSEDASDGESAGDVTPKPAEIELITNDANSYIAHTAANTAGDSIEQIITRQVNETLAKSLLQGLQTIRASLDEAAKLKANH